MTQPNKPGPSWEKELLTAAVDNFKEENPHLADDEYYHKADKSMTIRSFMKGARWAQEKGVMEMSPEESKKHNDAMLSFFGDEKAAAPGEESWEKLQVEEADKYSATHVGLGQRSAFHHGFDAAVNLIARPLGAELKIQDDANDILTRQCDELKAEAASLRAENERLKNFGAWQGFVPQYQEQIDTLRAQLAEAITTLELIAGPVEFYCEIGERNKQSAAQATLAKLKAGREEG